MDSFSNALRQAIYLLDCPLQVIADSASITRHAVYDAMRGAVRMRKKTARMLAISVCNLLHEQIDRREREIAKTFNIVIIFFSKKFSFYCNNIFNILFCNFKSN